MKVFLAVTFSLPKSLSKVCLIFSIKTEQATLLHEDLRVIWYDVAIDDGPKGDVVAGRLNVLVHQLLVVLPLQAQHQLHRVLQVAAHLAGQHPGVLGGLEADGPAGEGGTTLGNGPLEQTCGQGRRRKEDSRRRRRIGKRKRMGKVE